MGETANRGKLPTVLGEIMEWRGREIFLIIRARARDLIKILRDSRDPEIRV